MNQLDVINLHEEFFKVHGFGLNSSGFMFKKEFDVGRQVVFVHLVENTDPCFLEYKLGIRIDEVEQMIHQYLPILSNYADQSITLMQTPDNLGKNNPRQLPVNSSSELSEAIESMKEFFCDTGFKWLEELSNPVVLEQEFLANIEHPFESHNLVYSAFRSTALSKLYAPDDYPLLRQAFLAKIDPEEMTPITIASFLQFLDFLDHYQTL